MAIVAVAGRKGGIGKSTIAGNLAGEFVAMGWNVAALDTDPQHSLAAWADQGKGVLARCVQKVRRVDIDELRAQARAGQKSADIVLIDTPPGIPEITYEAMLLADLVLLPCGPSPLDLYPLKDAVGMGLKARSERGSKKPRIRFVPSKILKNTNLGRELAGSLEALGRKVLPGISQRIVLAEVVTRGLTVSEFAPASAARAEFSELARAVENILKR
jgi:chromosome partitioning protein